MKTFLITLICCSGALTCCNCHLPGKDDCYTKIANPVLEQSLQEYAADRVAEYKALGNSNWKDGNVLELRYDKIGDTLIYQINQTDPGWIIFLDERPLLITKICEVYVACYDNKFAELQMPVSAIVAFFATDFPQCVSEYEDYLLRRKTESESEASTAFSGGMYEGEYWILKFVKGKLVSKTIKFGIGGVDKIIYY